MTAYDPNNIFAKILRGEFPCYKVYENDHVLAFLDIMPRSPGHTLVIPKAPARNILDIDPGFRPCRARHPQDCPRRDDGFCGRRNHRAAIQRTRRRTGGVSSAHARDAAPQRHSPAAAGEPQGRCKGAGGARRQAGGGAEVVYVKLSFVHLRHSPMCKRTSWMRLRSAIADPRRRPGIHTPDGG